MSEAALDLIVSRVMTRRPHEATRTFRVRLATVDAERVTFYEVGLGDDRMLAAALEEARWRHTRIRVPVTFGARDDATKRALLQRALGMY